MRRWVTVLFSRSDCAAIGHWLGCVLKSVAAHIDTIAEIWGLFDPLSHRDLILRGRGGAKKRRLSKAFKKDVAEEAVCDGRAGTCGKMVNSLKDGFEVKAADLVSEVCHEHKAAALYLARPLHVISCSRLFIIDIGGRAKGSDIQIHCLGAQRVSKWSKRASTGALLSKICSAQFLGRYAPPNSWEDMLHLLGRRRWSISSKELGGASLPRNLTEQLFQGIEKDFDWSPTGIPLGPRTG